MTAFIPGAKSALAVVLLASLTMVAEGGRLRRGNDPRVRRLAWKAMGAHAEQEFGAVEAIMGPASHAVQREVAGLVPAKSEVLAQVVRSYFARERGWLIRGLEPAGLQAGATEVHDARVLQDRAPELAAVLRHMREHGRGFFKGDLFAVVAAIESLVLDSSAAVLEEVYGLHNISATEVIEEKRLHEVLTSYLIVMQEGMSRNLQDAAQHFRAKAFAEELDESWTSLTELERDTVQESGHGVGGYTFGEASLVARSLARKYGQWANSDCVEMKRILGASDTSASGRLSHSEFSALPNHTQFQFTESVDYLRSIGALDEADGEEPQVLISNYLLGPSNCMASSAFHASCCVNECEAIMERLEREVRAPAAPVQRLLDLVAGDSAAAGAPPQMMPPSLSQALHEVAEGGKVLLRGAAFAQWLHRAFPRECPRPVAPAATEEPGRSHGLKIATAAEQQVVLQGCTREKAWQKAAGGRGADRWSASHWFHAAEHVGEL